MAPSHAPQPAATLPYGRQSIAPADAAAVVAALHSGWLTTGPRVEEFEQRLAAQVGCAHGVAVNSGTAALHCALEGLGIGPGDEVIVPALTFAATASTVVMQQATPVFADVCPDTLLLDPDSVAARISPRTRAVVAVDYAGQACDYQSLQGLAERHGLVLLSDACHSLGGAYRGRPVGSWARATSFSFHPVKPITTAEGGMVVTDDAALAARMRRFRNHGISADHRQRQAAGSWFYEIEELGYNYRLSDLHCALGLSQLPRLAGWTERRREIAATYAAAFAHLPGILPLARRHDVQHAYHLYVVRWRAGGIDRNQAFRQLREAGLGVNVHYVPVHLHPFFRRRFGLQRGLCPVAEAAADEILSLPIFPDMTSADIARVIHTVTAVARQASTSAA